MKNKFADLVGKDMELKTKNIDIKEITKAEAPGRTEPQRKTIYKRFSIAIPEELGQKAQDLAYCKGKTFNLLIKDLLSEAIQQYEEEHKSTLADIRDSQKAFRK